MITNTFPRHLICPVEDKPLNDAILLKPCDHVISKVAINAIADSRIHQQINGSRICPLCKNTIVSYSPDLMTRYFVVNALIDQLEKIPFPGFGARFALTRWNWGLEENLNGPMYDIIRELEFTSQTQGSLFSKICVYGCRDGSIRLSLSFLDEKNVAYRYLLACGTAISLPHFNFYTTKEPIERKLLFNIIAKHNEIPASEFKLVRDLAMSDTWTTVTPL